MRWRHASGNAPGDERAQPPFENARGASFDQEGRSRDGEVRGGGVL